jgi:hypothetical protein
MKRLRIVLALLPMSLNIMAYAQSNADKSFDKLKTLAGSWEGTYEGKPEEISLRVTSSGNAFVHEATQAGASEDPLTMFYVQGDRLLLTHYCDAGNRPRMVGKFSPDGNKLEFNLIDVDNLNSKQFGHMQSVVFTMIDADHHSEDWFFKVEGQAALVDAHYDLHRK